MAKEVIIQSLVITTLIYMCLVFHINVAKDVIKYAEENDDSKFILYFIGSHVILFLIISALIKIFY